MKSYIFWGTIILIVLSAFIYANSFSAELTFDSVALVEHFERRSVQKLWSEFVDLKEGENRLRFIGFLTFALNYACHGPKVFGYHLVNVVIHLFNAFLVWWIALMLSMKEMTCFKSSKQRRIFALFAAGIFLVHPIQTQAVTYLYQRLAALVSLFYLLAVGCYVKARMVSDNRKKSILFFSLAGLSFVFGIFTKQNILTLPFMLLFLEMCFFQNKGFLKDRAFWKERFFWTHYVGVAVIVFLILVIFLNVGHAPFVTSRRLSNDHLIVNSYSYFLTQARVILKYFQLIIIPVGQSLDHDVYLSQTIKDWPTIFSGFIVMCFFTAGALLIRTRRLIGFGIFWFFITASIECSVIPIRHVIFEHRMYLPMVGLVISFSAWVVSRFSAKRSIVYLSILVVVLGGLTIRRNAVWKNGVTLWQDVIRKAPMQARGYRNLGKAYLEQGEYTLALQNLEIALIHDPIDSDQVYNNIGLIYYGLERNDLAVHYFQKALNVNPFGIGTYNNLGAAYKAMGNDDEAKKFFQYELNNSDHFSAHNNLGLILMKEGLLDEAEEEFKIVQRMDPYRIEAYKNLAILYKKKNDLAGEKDIYQQALKRFSQHIGIARSLFLLCLDQNDDVCVDKAFSVLLRNQEDQEDLTQLISLSALNGTFQTTQKYYQILLNRFSDHSILYLEYGKFLGNYNQFDQAIVVWEQGMKIAPEKANEFKVLIAQAQKLKTINNK